VKMVNDILFGTFTGNATKYEIANEVIAKKTIGSTIKNKNSAFWFIC